MSKNEKNFKIAIVGDKGVGKSKFLSICNITKHPKDDEKRNNSILNNDCFGVIVMFDMSRRESFENLVKWIIWLIDSIHYEGFITILGNYDIENTKFLCTTKEEVSTFLKLKTTNFSFFEIGNKNNSQKSNLIDSLIKNAASEYEKYLKDKKGCYIF